MRKRILVIIGLAVVLAGGWLAWQRWTTPTGQIGTLPIEPGYRFNGFLPDQQQVLLFNDVTMGIQRYDLEQHTRVVSQSLHVSPAYKIYRLGEGLLMAYPGLMWWPFDESSSPQPLEMAPPLDPDPRQITTILDRGPNQSVILGQQQRSALTENLFLWDWHTTQAQLITTTALGNPVLLSADGQTLLILDAATDTLEEWDLSTQRLRRTVALTLRDEPVQAALSPDGQRLAVGSITSGINLEADTLASPTYLDLVDLASGTTLQSWEQQFDRIFVITWSADGQRVAVGGGPDVMDSAEPPELDSQIAVYAVNDPGLLAAYAGHRERTRALLFAADGRSLWSAGFDAVLRQWQLP